MKLEKQLLRRENEATINVLEKEIEMLRRKIVESRSMLLSYKKTDDIKKLKNAVKTTYKNLGNLI